MSDLKTPRPAARPAPRGEACTQLPWLRRSVLVAMLAACSTLACAQDVNPDATGHEPVSTRAALEQARPVTARHAMVVSAQHLATMVGVDILKQGGNAVDAAVAVGFAEAVVHPCCGNIGGGGFMTIHLKDGRNLFLDFREKAPLKATPTMFQDAAG
ncbi:MAG TPA: gamma-glutamyltransferase, partial [Rhodanobacter sp.]|nr:gamma-glutamyltransferase [Rhodanobacter sp.]